MGKITALIITGLLFAYTSYSQEDIFTGMENTVGYIKDERGNKYIVIETPEGAKLIRTEKDPEEVLESSLGISKDDLNITGE
ncbi:MAG TPA: hypothetical protein DEP48_06685 [Persephonella sp.]|uniref:Uncharacterized protein n=1 Tax=Persephonella marina (strain DSM 14350 / EX-H1) TaxID=123214 RepID=C0QUI8_PERMH|nr:MULTISPECIES: hypothetical protein [Persephonella]ACO03513.1 hypothetical protein PERMA_0564 [Persephonella marina EX-H1]HCB70030.1 hypothetical protein [Persephonella sp.]